MQSPPAATPSAAAMAYLFADSWAPPDKALTMGTEVPCKGIKVQTRPLAAGLFATSFWSLFKDGFVTLDVYEHKRMLMHFTNAVATKVKDGFRPGLEGMILATLNPVGAGFKSARDTIRDIFGSDVSDPFSTVIGWVKAEAAEGGVMRAEVAGGLAGRFGFTDLFPVCEEIAKFQGYATSVISAWQTWAAQNAGFAQLLMEECTSAISSRTESDD